MSEIVLRGLDPLFASPLLRFEVPDAAALNARLIGEIAAMRAVSPGIVRSNQNGWHSNPDFFLRPEPGCVALRAHMIEAMRQATLQVAPRYDFAAVALQLEGWINVSGKGGYNTPHDHPGWAWSGVYYVAAPEAPTAEHRGGMIEFLDSRTNTNVVSIAGASCFSSKAQIRPKAGDLLLFPSFLKHWVYPNEQEAERISIAFNGRFAAR